MQTVIPPPQTYTWRQRKQEAETLLQALPEAQRLQISDTVRQQKLGYDAFDALIRPLPVDGPTKSKLWDLHFSKDQPEPFTRPEVAPKGVDVGIMDILKGAPGHGLNKIGADLMKAGAQAYPESQVLPSPKLPPSPDAKVDEAAFQKWYQGWAQKAGIDQNPDNPAHKYDYRDAFKAGVEPTINATDGQYHWPSQFKAQDHPNRFVSGVDTITGKPVTPSHVGIDSIIKKSPAAPHLGISDFTNRQPTGADQMSAAVELEKLKSGPRLPFTPDIQPMVGELPKVQNSNPSVMAGVPAGPQILDPSTRIGRLQNYMNVAASNFIEIAAGTLKSAGVAASTIPVERIGLTPQPPEEMALFKLGESISEGAKRMFPGNPEMATEFMTTLSGGAGSLAGFMASGIAGRAVKLPSMLVTTAVGAGSQGAAGYQEAKAAGVPEADVLKSWVANMGLGATEAIPVEKALSRLDKVSGGYARRWVKNRIARGLTEGSIEEFIQEFGQNLGSNVVAQMYYDKDRPTMGDVPSQALAGGILGGSLNAVFAALGLRSRLARVDRINYIREMERNEAKVDAEIAKMEDGTGSPAVVQEQGIPAAQPVAPVQAEAPAPVQEAGPIDAPPVLIAPQRPVPQPKSFRLNGKEIVGTIGNQVVLSDGQVLERNPLFVGTLSQYKIPTLTQEQVTDLQAKAAPVMATPPEVEPVESTPISTTPATALVPELPPAPLGTAEDPRVIPAGGDATAGLGTRWIVNQDLGSVEADSAKYWLDGSEEEGFNDAKAGLGQNTDGTWFVETRGGRSEKTFDTAAEAAAYAEQAFQEAKDVTPPKLKPSTSFQAAPTKETPPAVSEATQKWLDERRKKEEATSKEQEITESAPAPFKKGDKIELQTKPGVWTSGVIDEIGENGKVDVTVNGNWIEDIDPMHVRLLGTSENPEIVTPKKKSEITTEWTTQPYGEARRNITQQEVDVLNKYDQGARDIIIKGDQMRPPEKAPLDIGIEGTPQPLKPQAKLPAAPAIKPKSTSSNWSESIIDWSDERGNYHTIDTEVFGESDVIVYKSPTGQLKGKWVVAKEDGGIIEGPFPDKKAAMAFVENKFEAAKLPVTQEQSQTSDDALDAVMDQWEAEQEGKAAPSTEKPATAPQKPAGKFRYEVQADDSGKWYGNGLTFDTEAEAQEAADRKLDAWSSAREVRVVPVEPTVESAPQKTLTPQAPKATLPPTPDTAPRAPKTTSLPSTPKTGFGTRNTEYTEDRKKKASDIWKKQLGQLNMGLDPTLLKAIVDIGGYYFEGGVREIGAWTKAVIEDTGEAARPYLVRIHARLQAYFEKKEGGLAKDPSKEENKPNAGDKRVSEDQGSGTPSGEDSGQSAKGTSGETGPGKSDIGPAGGVSGGGTTESGTEGSDKRKLVEKQSYGRFSLVGKAPVVLTPSQRREINAKARELIEEKNPGDPLTAEEQDILRQYTGEGGLGTDTEGVLFEHYTSYKVVQWQWNKILSMGYPLEGASYLEPAGGVGNYVGFAPEGMDATVVEIDPVAAKITALLYPHAKVENEPFENFFSRKKYDIIISNVPFNESRGALRYEKDAEAYKDIGTLHDFFFVKGLDLLKPNGMMVFLTSTGTMDKMNPSVRRRINAEAEFLGAYRTPAGEFKGNTGYGGSVDAIFLRKRTTEEKLQAIVEAGTPGASLEPISIFQPEFIQAVQTDAFSKPGQPSADLSKYYVDNPEQAWGQLEAGYGVRQVTRIGVRPTGPIEDFMANSLGDDIKWVPKETQAKPVEPEAELVPLAVAPEGIKSGTLVYHKDSKQLAYASHGNLYAAFPKGLSPNTQKRVMASVQMMDMVDKLYSALRVNDVAEADRLRAKLKKAITQYREEFKSKKKGVIELAPPPGYDNFLWRFLNGGTEGKPLPFADPRVWLLAGITDDKGKLSSIFTNNTIWKPEIAPRQYDANSIEDVAKFVYEETGEFNPEKIAELYKGDNISSAAVSALLAGKPGFSITSISADGQPTVDINEEYLYGSIWPKLDAVAGMIRAVLSGQLDVKFRSMLRDQQDELIKVLPEQATFKSIPIDVFGSYMDHATIINWLRDKGLTAEIELSPENNRYMWIVYGRLGEQIIIEGPVSREEAVILKRTAEREGRPVPPEGFTREYRIGADEIQDFLNHKRATKKIPTGESDYNGRPKYKTVFDIEGQDALNQLSDNFVAWFKANKPKTEHLVPAYNRMYRSFRHRTFEGSEVNVPGLSATFKDQPTKIHKHQWQVVEQLLHTRSGIDAHGVGGGKTMSGIILAQLGKHRGFFRKPVLVVPAKVIKNWGFEITQLFPEAVVLDSSNMSSDNRNKVLARVSASDADFILVTYEGMKEIPLRAAEGYIQEDLREFVERLRLLEEKKGQKDKKTITQLQNQIRKFEEKLAKIQDMKKTNAVFFEDLGVDAIIVDEMHNHKNAPVTYMDMSEWVHAGDFSERAADMMYKTRYIHERKGGRRGQNVFGLTATPTPNNPIEIYSMLKYVAPAEWTDRGIMNGGDFIEQFGIVGAIEEASTTGVPKVRTVFKGYKNLRDLRAIFKRYVDMRPTSVFAISRPNAQFNEHVAAPPPAVIFEAARIGELQGWVESKPKDAAIEGWNHLSVLTLARKLAADLAIYNPFQYLNELGRKGSKLEEIIRQVKDNDTGENTQLVFVDLYRSVAKVPAGSRMEELLKQFIAGEGDVDAIKNLQLEDDANELATGTAQADDDDSPAVKMKSYEIVNIHKALKQALVDSGIPESQIAIINQGSNNSAKAKFKVQQDNAAGTIRFLIGTTQSMGEGMNLQANTTDIHHYDVPWTPAALEQREGRGVRQGNKNNLVRVHRYVGRGTSDAKMYAILHRKSEWNHALWFGDEDTVTDFDQDRKNYGDISADAQIDESTLEYWTLARTISVNTKKLSDLQSDDLVEAVRMRDKVAEDIDHRKKAIEKYQDQVNKGNGSDYIVRLIEQHTSAIAELEQELIGRQKTVEDAERGRKNLETSLRADKAKLKELIDGLKAKGMPVLAEHEALLDKEEQIDTAPPPPLKPKTGLPGSANQALSQDRTEDRPDSEGGSYSMASPPPPLTPTTPAPQTAPLSRTGLIGKREILADLSKRLNVPLRTGRFRHRAWGIFKPKQNVARTKQALDLPVAAHELGHAINKILWGTSGKGFALNWRPLAPFRKELSAIATKPRAGQSPLPEGFAEFIRMYLTDPAMALSKAPHFHKFFEGELRKNTELEDILRDARENIKRYRSQPAAAKILSMVSFGEEEPHKANRWNSFYAATFDRFDPIKKVTDETRPVDIENDPYKLARLFSGWIGRAEHFLQYGSFDAKTGAVNGQSLQKILEPVKDRLDDLRVYLIARRVIEKGTQGINSGIELSDAKQALKDFDSPEFQKIADALYLYQDSLVQYLVDRGMMSQESAVAIRNANQDYVPFYRLMEAAVGAGQNESSGGAGTSKFADLWSPTKRMKGSSRMIVDPLESIIKNTYAFINLAERNRVADVLVREASKHPDMGWLVESVATPMAPTQFSLERIRTHLESIGIDLTGINIDVVTTVFGPQSKGSHGDNVISVFRDGKRKFYQVDPELYRALEGLDEETAPLAIRLLAMPAKLLRLGATGLGPEFMFRNPGRDTMDAFMQSEYGFKPGIDTIRGLLHALKRDDLYKEWLRSGGAMTSLAELDRDNLQLKIKDLMATPLGYAVRHPIEALRLFSTLSEEASRLGEFALARKHGASVEEGGFASREATIDFARRGTTTRIVNMVAAFWNANLQGQDKFIRTHKKNFKRTVIRGTLGMTLPSLLLYLLNRDNPDYEELRKGSMSWLGDLFWLIPTRGTPLHGYTPFIPIPKPFLYGLVYSSIPERVMEWIDKNDSSAFDGLTGSLVHQIPVPAVSALTPMMEAWANKSAFTGRPLTPSYLMNFPIEDRYEYYTSEPAKLFSEFAVKLGLPVSPMQVDNAIFGYSGGMGRMIIDALNPGFRAIEGLPPGPAWNMSDVPGLKAFAVRFPSGSLDSVQKFYNRLEELEQRYAVQRESLRPNSRFSKPPLTSSELIEMRDLRRYNTLLQDYRRRIRDIVDADMDTKERRDRINEIQLDIANTARRAFDAVIKKRPMRAPLLPLSPGATLPPSPR